MQAKRLSLAILLAALCTQANATAPTTNNTFTDDVAFRRADLLVQQMTLDEKLQMIHSQYAMGVVPGGGAGYIQGVPRLKIPDLGMVDSATGSGSGTQPSTTFPATIALAASWDPQLAYRFGARIADQIRAQGFGMGLGGGTNLARDPRGGRLFEYLGEDPVLAGEMLAARTQGTQSRKVIATLKHYVGNEQETNRFGGNSQIDERTLRELYLLPFEIALKKGQPGNVMCSYNRLNGDYACENRHVLSDILKNEWHFAGQVQSDWGATHSTANAINAGLDEEEDVGPTVYLTPDLVKQALDSKAISPRRFDDMVRRKLYVMIRTGVMDDPPHGGGTIDFAAANAFAQYAEEQSIVLLKNADSQLPLDTTTVRRIAVIGGHADAGVLTGGGSGDTRDPVTGAFAGCGGLTFGSSTGCQWWSNPWLKLDVPIVKAIQALVPGASVTYAGSSDQQTPFRAYTQQEIDDAVALAQRSDVAIVVVTQSSGEDFGELTSLALSNPSNQDALVQAVAQVNPHVIIVVESGNPVLMPWRDQVAAIVQAWYPGEGGGRAIANVLFGKVNPSGKLPVTFPVRDEDTPTWGRDGTFAQNPVYTEKLKMGYRWYDANHIQPAFPFGYGLSYTHFSYSSLSVNTTRDETTTVSFLLRNDGPVAGAEVAQVYLGDLNDKEEPPKRLVAWQKVQLDPGETQRVTLTIPSMMRRVWNTSRNIWTVATGGHISVGASSRDIRLVQR
ncbi:beta-glucosidase family protein [Trinickia fusca]|uniref:Glycosyl hydrolase n=1 Tax=Trinickia fusca TaxID=2419777 RepID=A0A494X5H4_9BURK|nr:glycoside hydrolase family 3 C-terminal domain-containing protein [Trinickia fusca]RKP45945.1 glycosyl hydrolase [Trinickia fusca]